MAMALSIRSCFWGPRRRAFVAFLEEHVYRSLFEAALLSPPFFYNQAKTLGYSDAFLLNQIFYSPLRLLGVDSLLAISLTIVALSVFAYAFIYLTLRRLEVPVLIACLASLIFTFPNNLFLKSGHQQHFAVYYLPPIMYCTLAAITSVHANRWRAYILGAIAGGLYGLLFSTGYYVAWFFGLALLIFIPTIFLVAWPSVRFWSSENFREATLLLLVSCASFAGAITVFLPSIPPSLPLELHASSTNTFLMRPGRTTFLMSGR